MPSNTFEATTFLNVDLDIRSRQDLDPLIAALGRRILVLHAARHGRTYTAHLELARSPKSSDAAIRAFAGLIRALPKGARRLWDTATVRDFNIGVQAAMQPHAYEIALAHETIEAVSALRARIVLTVYAAEEAGTAKGPISNERRSRRGREGI